MKSQSIRTLTYALFLLAASLSYAQQSSAPKAEKPVVDPAPSAAAADLQKAVQNPVASLISVPIQNNSNFGVGDYDRTQNVLNIQPVIPGKLTENWNYIARIISANYLAAVSKPDDRWRIRIRRHESHVIHFAIQARQIDLGRWPCLRHSDGYE